MQTLINQIEALIHRDVGRGMEMVFQATKGSLWEAVVALAAMPAPKIGFITGFFVPGGNPPAAETDGPAGAALLAAGFLGAGISCRLATDTVCEAACRSALTRASAGAVPIDAITPNDTTDALITRWRDEGIEWAIAIERCGPAADGVPRNMRGIDVSPYAAPLDRLFNAGPWRTIAIGDGGNELGMGLVPRPLIAEHVPLGEAIGCVVPADFLITAGVSHWGAYAVLAALSLQHPLWSASLRTALDPVLDQAIVEAMVMHGPAVDGVSLRREATIDALSMASHHRVLDAMLALLRTADP